MKKIFVLILLSLTISQVFSDEENNNKSDANSENKYFKIARSLYQKPFGETLCLPFIWLGNLAENKNNSNSSNKQELKDSDQQRNNLTNWSQLSMNYFTTTAKHGIDIITGASQKADHINKKGKFGVQYRHEISGKITDKFYFDVQEDIFISEKSHEERNSFLYNDAKLKLYYQNQNHFMKLQYTNRYYQEDETVLQSSPSLMEAIPHKSIHNTYLSYKGNIDKFDFSFLSSVRNLNYRYFRLEVEDDGRDDDEDEWTTISAWENDWITNIVAGYQLSDAVRFFGKAYYKDDLNESDVYDHLQFGAGLEYNNRFDLFNSFFARFTYLNNKSEAIADYKDHYFLTEARYTKRFFNGIAGFISYINRSCYDKDNSKLLRISNVVKMHLKYSYLLSNTKDSFVLAGIRFNPENDGNLIFGELNQYLLKDLYLGAGAKFAPELYTQFIGKLEFFLSPVKSFWIKNEYTDFKKRNGQNIVSLGTTLIF